MKMYLIPPVSVIIPRSFFTASEKYFVELVSNNDFGFMTMIRFLSFGLVKRLTSLSVDELQEFMVDQKGFIIAYKAYSQLVRKSQE